MANSAGITASDCKGDAYADMVMSCAGEEWDHLSCFAQTLSPEEIDAAYNPDRSGARNAAEQTVASGRFSNDDEAIDAARTHVRCLLTDASVRATIEAVANEVLDRGTLDRFYFQFLRSQMAFIEAVVERCESQNE